MTEFTKTCSAELEGVQVGDILYATTKTHQRGAFDIERLQVVKVTPKQIKVVKVYFNTYVSNYKLAFNKVTGMEITSFHKKRYIIALEQNEAAANMWNAARESYYKQQDIEQERARDHITHDVHIRRMLIGSQQVEELCIVSEMEFDRDIKELTAQDIQFLENVIDQWHIRNN